MPFIFHKSVQQVLLEMHHRCTWGQVQESVITSNRFGSGQRVKAVFTKHDAILKG